MSDQLAIVLWFTGLSGSGKSTIADKLKKRLEKKGKKVLIIDGDMIRNTLHKHLKFTPSDIKKNNRLTVKLCASQRPAYDYIIVSLISPFRESRKQARKKLSPDFLEIYIKAGLRECIRRDVKGLYRQALAGNIKNFIGVSKNTPYEPPEKPELVVDTKRYSPATCVKKILARLKKNEGGTRKQCKKM
jgi:adenylyl-sulfate kinase